VHGSSASCSKATVDPLLLLTVVGAGSHHDVAGASEGQDDVSGREWAGVRSRARPARRRDAVALCRRQGHLVARAVRSTPGGQQLFSDLVIEPTLTLRLVFSSPLRQTEDFLRSVLALMRADLEAPDHTTLSRRSRQLDVKLRGIPASGPIHLIIDSTGLSIVGEGEWAAAKHGGRGQRGWKKRRHRSRQLFRGLRLFDLIDRVFGRGRKGTAQATGAQARARVHQTATSTTPTRIRPVERPTQSPMTPQPSSKQSM